MFAVRRPRTIAPVSVRRNRSLGLALGAGAALLAACGPRQQAPGSDGGAAGPRRSLLRHPAHRGRQRRRLRAELRRRQRYATAGDAGFGSVGGPQTLEMWINDAAAAGTQDFLVLRTDFESGGRPEFTTAPWPPGGSMRIACWFRRRPPQRPGPGITSPTPTTAPLTFCISTGQRSTRRRSPPTMGPRPPPGWGPTVGQPVQREDGRGARLGLTRTPAQVAADMAHTPAGAQPGWSPTGRSTTRSTVGARSISPGPATASRLVTALVLMPSRVPSTAPVDR